MGGSPRTRVATTILAHNDDKRKKNMFVSELVFCLSSGFVLRLVFVFGWF